jgi:hypothetical protein
MLRATLSIALAVLVLLAAHPARLAARPVFQRRGTTIPRSQHGRSPSANDAAVVTVSTEVRVNDEALGAGTYTLWTEPGPERWIVIFSRAHPAFHLKHPEGQDALRVEAVPREASHMRVMGPLRLDVP